MSAHADGARIPLTAPFLAIVIYHVSLFRFARLFRRNLQTRRPEPGVRPAANLPPSAV